MVNPAVQKNQPLDAPIDDPRSDESGFERLTIDEPASSIMSPARRMQATLGREFAAVDELEPWPIRRTVAFVMLTCGAFWTAVYFAISALTG